MDNKQNEYMEIDLLHIIKLLWRRAWIIILAMILAGGIAFAYSVFYITPLYQSSAMMFVNGSTVKLGSTEISISSKDFATSKSLLDIYIVVLKTRTTLEEVAERSGLNYSYSQLNGMVSASSVNDTEIFSITVTGPNPEDNKIIIDTIVDVLPGRISDIIDGTSVRVVDHAVKATYRSSPNYTRYASMGMLVGAVIACAIIIIVDLLDTTVRDEEFLKQKYNIPVLAVIPDIYESGKTYSKKYYRNYYNYGTDQDEAKKEDNK